MGAELRKVVEHQLIEDLTFYGIEEKTLRFDWSESCIEGHQTFYLDGSVENFSGIGVFDDKNNVVADGWMEFIHDEKTNFFLTYWEFVRTYDKGRKVMEKSIVGIPDHIWKRLSKDLQSIWQKLRAPYHHLP